MTDAERHSVDRSIALALADAVSAAAAGTMRVESVTAARDAAHVLGLQGLQRALALCVPHAGRPAPPEFEPLLDRVRRLAAATRAAGALAPFRAADAEVGALAAELDAIEWSDPDDPERAAVATLGVEQVLEDHAIAGEDARSLARRSRLAVPVAAAVRAALDWLAPRDATERTVRLHGEPSLLELRLDRVALDRLDAAERVIAEVGGNLGPAPDAVNGLPWILRVPSFAHRATYLLVVQGGLRIAIPWHAVIKLRMIPAIDLAAAAERLEHPALETIGTPASAARDLPAVLVGHGTRRAYVIADRVIWRMMADPRENEWGSPGLGLRETVETDEGEVFWVLDAATSLAAVARLAPVTPDDEPGAAVEPYAIESAEAAAGPSSEALPDVAPTPPAPEPIPLTRADVEPLDRSRMAPVQLAVASPAAEPPLAAPAAPRTRVARRALVADDSLAARARLARVLEHHGWETAAFGTAAELRAALRAGGWTVVLTDVELPDARGAGGLADTCDAAAESQPPARIVALVRDRTDAEAARAAGITDTLLKPVDRATLVALLGRIVPGGLR